MEFIKTNYGEFTDSEDENIVSKENNENIEKDSEDENIVSKENNVNIEKKIVLRLKLFINRNP